jgi:predicted RNA binding protein YcfA (HicA-like mRNA interferase family)
MSRKLRIISGKEVIKILESYGFVITRTVGSHARLTLQAEHKETFHITVPLHFELKRGTLRGIISGLEKYISSEKLDGDFYTQ